MPIVGDLVRKQLIQNREIKRWVLKYLKSHPGLIYEMIKEVVGRDGCGYEPEDVNHVVILIGTGHQTAYTSGGCVHASGPISGQGECAVPSHLYIGCELVMEDLRAKHPDLDEMLANSRADQAARTATTQAKPRQS